MYVCVCVCKYVCLYVYLESVYFKYEHIESYDFNHFCMLFTHAHNLYKDVPLVLSRLFVPEDIIILNLFVGGTFILLLSSFISGFKEAFCKHK